MELYIEKIQNIKYIYLLNNKMNINNMDKTNNEYNSFQEDQKIEFKI